ncbi:MAG: MBOAT family O-acyltransferase [Saprospiraceae bacterium]
MWLAINWTDISPYFAYDPGKPMLFNSMVFLVWFMVFYGGYLCLKRQANWRLIYTLAFSLFFYYKSSGIYFLLLILSTLIDFFLGHFIFKADTPLKRKAWLILSLFANLGLLFYFKYTNFFIGTINSVAGTNWAFQSIFLPVGISFFTFQTMSYSIDVYRGKLIPLTEGIKDIKSFFTQLLDFSFFVSFFPQLVAGPIVRAADFIPQIRQPLQLSERDLGRALLLICGGLFKKAVISDYISINFVDRVFENPALYSGFENLMAAYGYAIQIYCDFSGYSDMAIGLALIMGLRLPENFRLPYQADTIKDFWRRWHISLSTWLRDYLYISLGGSRKGKLRTYLNLMLTMLLGGLWHGASWVFVIWGGLHGMALALDRGLETAGKFWRDSAIRAGMITASVQLLGQLALFAAWQTGNLETLSYQDLSAANAWVAMAWCLMLLCAYALDLIMNTIGFKNTRQGRQTVSLFLVFHFVTLCWVFFRAGALGNPLGPWETTAGVLTQILTAFHPELAWEVVQSYPQVFGLIALGIGLHFLPLGVRKVGEEWFIKLPWPLKGVALALVIWLVTQTASSDVVPFIYFQF